MTVVESREELVPTRSLLVGQTAWRWGFNWQLGGKVEMEWDGRKGWGSSKKTLVSQTNGAS